MATRITRSSTRVSSGAVSLHTIPVSRPSTATTQDRKRKKLAAEEIDKAEEESLTIMAKKPSLSRKQDAHVPNAVSLTAEPIYVGPTTPKPKARTVSRLASIPNATRATVVSPETFRVIKAGISGNTSSVSKLMTATTGDDELLQTACRHLISVDPRMKPIIDKHYCRIFSAEGLAEKIDPFESLVSSMISQLISGAAARTIKRRFVEMFADADNPEQQSPFPTPSAVAARPLEEIRQAGLSQRTATYIKGLAEKFVAGELSASMLADAPYEELHKTLLAVPGLGAWSVEMFACFALKRPDVFSTGDLGVQRGMAVLEGRDVAKLKKKGGKWKYMPREEMETISAKFAPYRSIFMWYMWRVEETDISTLE